MRRTTDARMSRVVEWLGVLTSLTLAGGCSSPSAPDPRVPPPVGTPTHLMFQACTYGPQSATCHIQAKWGELYASYRDVTTDAAWFSDAPSVVRVASPGTLLGGAPGDAHVNVTYEGAVAVGYFHVYPGEPVPWQFWPDAVTPVRIVDVAGNAVEGATLDVVSLHNAGMQAVSDRIGTATLRAVVCGPITVRVSKAGYSTWTGSWFMCVDRVPAVVLSSVPS